MLGLMKMMMTGPMGVELERIWSWLLGSAMIMSVMMLMLVWPWIYVLPLAWIKRRYLRGWMILTNFFFLFLFYFFDYDFFSLISHSVFLVVETQSAMITYLLVPSLMLVSLFIFLLGTTGARKRMRKMRKGLVYVLILI